MRTPSPLTSSTSHTDRILGIAKLPSRDTTCKRSSRVAFAGGLSFLEQDKGEVRSRSPTLDQRLLDRVAFLPAEPQNPLPFKSLRGRTWPNRSHSGGAPERPRSQGWKRAAQSVKRRLHRRTVSEQFASALSRRSSVWTFQLISGRILCGRITRIPFSGSSFTRRYGRSLSRLLHSIASIRPAKIG